MSSLLKRKKFKVFLTFIALLLFIATFFFLKGTSSVDTQIESGSVASFLNKLPYKEVASLGAVGTQGHQSDDIKGDIVRVEDIRDNYGVNLEDKFGNYALEFVTYANDLFEVNHLTHYAEYYSALAQSIKSKNFPLLFVLRNKEQEGDRERFTLYALASDGSICQMGFDFFIRGDIDEGEDFYTSNSLFNHVTFYKHSCDRGKKVSEILNG